MSLQAQAIPPIPEMTVTVAKAAFRKGNTYMQMRDTLGTFFTDDQFLSLYPVDGQPAYAPWRLALVSVMQFAENLTDRQSADAVRSRIDWKYALSLELTDEGFDFSVLSEFRQRLLEHEVGEQLLNQMLEHFREADLLDNGGKQRTDSTYVIASVRDLNRLEFVGRTLQQALDAIALVAPVWIQTWVSPDWFQRYNHPMTEFRLPQKQSERDALMVQIGYDGLALLSTVLLDARTPEYLRQLEAIEIVRQVWLQQFVLIDDELRQREREEMPAAAKLIQSPFDLEARYSRKRSQEWLGYKVHLSETCDENTPHFITHVFVTNATQQDFDTVESIHEGMASRSLLPEKHLVDMGYTSAPLLYDSMTNYGVNLLGPLWEKQVWQHETGYDASAFTIDWEARTVTCPQGHTSNPWTMRDHRRDHQLTRVKFKRIECEPCPVHDLCTKHPRRTLSFHEQELFEMVQQRKAEQHTEEWREEYGKRAGIEGTISLGVFALGARRSRYRGMDKTQLQFVLTAAAINLTRVLNWQNEVPRSETRTTHFGKLVA
jgi:transposase